MTVKSITEITDHQVAADNRLPAQYEEAPGIHPNQWGPDLISGWTGTIFSFVDVAQDMEDIMNKMLAERGLLTAEGVNLDRLGAIVGQSRDGLSDADYLNQIIGKIAQNNSDGTGNNLLNITSILLGDNLQQLELFEIYPAKVRIDYFVDVPIVVDSTNNQFELSNIVDGQPNVAQIIPVGSYFPGAFDTVLQGIMTAYWTTAAPVSYDAATRIYTLHLDLVTMVNPPAVAEIVLQSAAPLFGFTDPTTITAVSASGTAVAGPDFDPVAIQNTLESAKAAGVDIQSERVIIDNYFGFQGDILSQGFGVLDGVILIGGGNYSVLLPAI